jgi:lysyl-tRNA synthetase class 2
MAKDFLPTASLECLQQRSVILKKIRAFFDQRHFIEVETPLLSHDIVVDRYIQPISVSAKEVMGDGPALHDEDPRLWLQTSPEFGMKRLLAAGAQAIYQITKAFRSGERGRLHNPEFTMLEWYRVGDDLQKGMGLLAHFVTEVLHRKSVQRTTYQQVFEQTVGIDPHSISIEELRELCRSHGIETATFQSEEFNRDFWLNLILTHVIEKTLGVDQPTIVYDWPASQSALAIVRQVETPVAERFELYVDGMEIANGYHELLDPDELSHRNCINNQLRIKDGNRVLPEESKLIEAMHHGLPPCAGVALGIDRLVMLATGMKSINEVISFPIENA